MLEQLLIIQDLAHPFANESFPHFSLLLYTPFSRITGICPTNTGWIGEGRREINKHSLNFSVCSFCHNVIMQL